MTWIMDQEKLMMTEMDEIEVPVPVAAADRTDVKETDAGDETETQVEIWLPTSKSSTKIKIDPNTIICRKALFGKCEDPHCE